LSLFDRYVHGLPLDQPRDNVALTDGSGITSSSESEEISLDYIIREKPPVKIVRDFFRDCLAIIKSDEEIMFR
jgi:hypothetical protein